MGNIYAVVDEHDQVAASLLWNSLTSACTSGYKACLLTAADAAPPLTSELADEVQTAINAKNLSVFQINPPRRTGKFLVHQMLNDLKHWGADQCQLLIIHGAEILFPALDISMLHAWRDWAEQHGKAVVLTFSQGGHEESESLRALTACAQVFAGMARLKSRYGATSLEIFHWFNEHGLVAGKSFPIRLDSDGRLKVFELDDDAPHAAELAADESQIVAMKSAFLPKESYPADWRIAEDDLNFLQALTIGAVAATVVLSFTPASDFDRIARCVFNLRKQCGPRLKIIIREVNSRLRYSQEALAVRLGTNLIVPAEISYARFLSLTSMTQGQVFPHSLPATYEQALKDAMPEFEHGYLPPAEFAQSALGILAHSRVLNVQNALIRLRLAYGLMPLDALRYCNIKRAGDLCSSDATSIYVFLYACRENDVDTTLERLFALPVSDLFSSDERFFSTRTIEETLHDYEERRVDGNFPDLSKELAHVVESTPQARREDLSLAIAKGGPAIVRYAAPAPAVRRPLSLRSAPTLIDVSISLP